MDTIYIKGLEVETVIGVYEHERNIKQPLFIDLEMDTDTLDAGKSDALEDAIDYAAVSEHIIRFAEQSRFQLIEAFANQLTDQLLTEFDLTTVRLRVSKPTALQAADTVGISMQRSR